MSKSEHNTPDIQVAIAHDRLSATLRVRPGLTPDERSFDAVRSAALAAGVSARFLDTEALRALVDDYDIGEGIRDAVIARGIPAKDARPGFFDVAPDLAEALRSAEALAEAAPDEPKPQREQRDGDGEDRPSRRSHYDRSAFVIVSPGHKLGVMRPPVPGEDGVDVASGSIPARDVAQTNIAMDESVQVSPNGEVHARVPGRLVATATRLCVERNLVVPEGVDFSTGNIDFPGDVRVIRGVRDCFEVRVGGSLEVCETVDAAIIETRRHARLLGGMAGRGKGVVRTGGDLEARYLDGVEIHIGGALRVEKQINDVRATVLGPVEAPTCHLIGGAARFVGGATLREVGSPAGQRTRVELGRQIEIERLAEETTALMREVAEQAASANQQLETIRTLGARMTASQAEQLTELQFLASDAETKGRALVAALDRLLTLIDETASPTLEVREAIHAGVEAYLGAWRIRFKVDVKGPVRLHLGEDEEPRLTDLDTDAVTSLRGVGEVEPDPEAIDLGPARALLREHVPQRPGTAALGDNGPSKRAKARPKGRAA